MSGHTEYKRLQETDLEEGLVAVELQGRDINGKTVAVPFDSGLTPESVLRLPLFENDNEASSLIQYSPYRTSTGEIRFKLPTVEPTGLWDFAAIWDFTKLWNI